MTRVPFTVTWIEQGKILAGSIPQLSEDIDVLKELGVRDIVSLTRRNIETYPFLLTLLSARQITVTSFPIPDGSIADDATMLSAAGFIDIDYRHDKCVYVHCRGGIGRTGTILLAYYVLHRDMSLAEAKELVKVRRNYEGNASAIDQGSPQKEWIDQLESKRVQL